MAASVSSIALAPEYDSLTRTLSDWVRDVGWASLPVRVEAGSSATAERLSSFLRGVRGVTSLVVFCGHGSDTALLAAPQDESDEHAVLCDQESVRNETTVHWIAWCCAAGKHFGPYVAYHPRAAFIGFNETLLLPTTAPELALEPLDKLVKACLVQGIGVTPALANRFRRDIETGISALRGRRDPEAVFARMSLRLQLESLVFIN